ncbi:MAG: GNAT family N-acetyltransferase [Maribacter sp.]|nr:GNAT family N-acetyltransferase [Maribacter sp.]
MNFDLQPLLQSDLVVIRPLKTEDFNNLYEVASDPLIWVQHQNQNRHTLEEFTQFFRESQASLGALTIVNKKTKQIIGSSRFKIIDDAEGVVEIGWSFLARKYWGGFYNGDIKKLMVNYALNSRKKVIFYVDSKNFRSQRALEKLGAKKSRNFLKSWVLPENKGMTYVIDKKFE